MFPDDRTPQSRGGNVTHGALLCFFWNTTFPLIPHCCGFIAAQEPCTNNGVSPLAPGWARDQREPIRARQSFLCVISQCWKFAGGNSSLMIGKTKTSDLTWVICSCWIKLQGSLKNPHRNLIKNKFLYLNSPTLFWNKDQDLESENLSTVFVPLSRELVREQLWFSLCKFPCISAAAAPRVQEGFKSSHRLVFTSCSLTFRRGGCTHSPWTERKTKRKISGIRSRATPGGHTGNYTELHHYECNHVNI